MTSPWPAASLSGLLVRLPPITVFLQSRSCTNGTLRLFRPPHPLHCLLTACHPNGTVTAVAVKVESVPSLDPKWLTLKDQSCKSVHGDDRFAFFTFTVDSCGTTRKVSGPVFKKKKLFKFVSKFYQIHSLYSFLMTTSSMRTRLAKTTTREKDQFLQLQLIPNTSKVSFRSLMMCNVIHAGHSSMFHLQANRYLLLCVQRDADRFLQI